MWRGIKIIGRGRVGEDLIYIGKALEDSGEREAWLDFTKPLVVLLVGRRRVGKSYTLRKIVETLADQFPSETKGSLPKFILLDPLGNLEILHPRVKEIEENELKIPFHSVTIDELCEYLTVGSQARVIKRILRKGFELNAKKTKEEFCRLINMLVLEFPLHDDTQRGIQERIEFLENDNIIVDGGMHILEYLKKYQGIRINLSSLRGDSFKLRFICQWLCRELLEYGKEIVRKIAKTKNNEEIKKLKKERLVLLIDEYHLLNFACIREFVRESGNAGISVVLASQQFKDFSETERLADVIFGFQMEDPRRFYEKFFRGIRVSPEVFRPKLDVGEALVWQNDGERGFKIKIGKCRSLHLGGD